MKTINEVKDIFKKEFHSIRYKFSNLEIPALAASTSDDEYIHHGQVS